MAKPVINNTAGGLSRPGQANALMAPSESQFDNPNPFRPQDGALITGLKGQLRVAGSADPQDFGAQNTDDGRPVGPDRTR